jgi:hypothetical protein
MSLKRRFADTTADKRELKVIQFGNFGLHRRFNYRFNFLLAKFHAGLLLSFKKWSRLCCHQQKTTAGR